MSTQIRHPVVICCAVFTASLCTQVSLGRSQPPSPPSPISPASQLELPRLIDLCSQRLSLRIDYDPAALKGQVTLRLPDSLSEAELWSLTHQLLSQRGFTTVKAPGAQTLSVVKTTDAPQLSRLEPIESGSDLSRVGVPGYASILISPRNRSSKEVADAIRPLLSKAVGSVTTLGDSQFLLVSDFTPRLAEIQSILERFDAPSARMIVEEIVTANVPPTALAASVMQVAQKRDQMAGDKLIGEVLVSPNGVGVLLIAPDTNIAAWKSLISQLDQREQLETRNYVPRVFPARDVAKLIEESVKVPAEGNSAREDRLRIVVDELTGTLMLTATPSQHAHIETVMARLDAAQGGPLPMRSFPIRNRPVNEMVTTLSRLIESGIIESAPDSSRLDTSYIDEQRTRRDITSGEITRAASPASSTLAPAPPSTSSSATPPSTPLAVPTLRLTADESTNTLIAVGEPRQLSQLESLLRILDVRQPQVMLEAVLVSMTDTDALNLGIELEKLGNVGDAAYKIASLFGLSGSSGGNRSVADTSGFTGAVLNPGEFNVVVRALQAINKGRSLSNPKVLVANNEQARFSSVLQQPFVRTDTTSSTATSSFGGSDSAGTTISVRPQIAQGDHLVLTYSINLSSFVGTPASAGLPPPKQQNSVDSVATIPDGHTVVVGGLELESESTSTSQVPLLGDVPLVGELFKSRSTGTSRTRFFVFIRAAVLRHNNFEDLKFISTQDALSMKVPDGWPRVEPRVIR